MDWAAELSEHDIQYESRTSIKEQVVAFFLVGLTPSKADQEKTKVDVFLCLVDLDLQCTLFVDGSSNIKGHGAEILLVSLMRSNMSMPLCSTFGYQVTKQNMKHPWQG